MGVMERTVGSFKVKSWLCGDGRIGRDHDCVNFDEKSADDATLRDLIPQDTTVGMVIF